MTALFESQEELRVILRAHKAGRLSLRKDIDEKQAKAYEKVRKHFDDREASRLEDDVGYWD